MILIVGAIVWLVVYTVATNGSSIAATIMACAAMFAVLMLLIREREGMVQRRDPVRHSQIGNSSGSPSGFLTPLTQSGTSFVDTAPKGYAAPFTLPSPSNPLMNVLPPNNGAYGNRPPAAPSFNRKVEQQINDEVIQDVAGKGMINESELQSPDCTKSLIYQDLGAEISLADSMRVFNAQPSTTTPNDQNGFAEFCFGSLGQCMKGGELFCRNPSVPATKDPSKNAAEPLYRTSGQDVLQPPKKA
jgi:hypothetical protein